MPHLSPEELLTRVIKDEIDPREFVLGAVDRVSGKFLLEEGQQVDHKLLVGVSGENAVAELARDILAFSNSNGGVLIFGVEDVTRIVRGHARLDSPRLRSTLGVYAGTRVDFEIEFASPVISGKQLGVPIIVVPRSHPSYPTLLRKDIGLKATFGRRVKYLAGSLFYRDGKNTLVEPTGGAIDERANALGFTGASPRTRSSFLLEEDRPHVRLYSHINDRFFGRENEVAEILAKFDDVRGRGVSIAGLGGIGKTEFGIEVTHRLYKSGRFPIIYSGSAKRTVLGTHGPQETDPFFSNFPSFLQDLGAWLGLDLHNVKDLVEIERECLQELKKSPKALLFVDNLETIDDGRLFAFLDERLPQNSWVFTTSRLHKVRNWVYAKQLDALDVNDAARLLRHELKRQGLDQLAATHIGKLEDCSVRLDKHPLMIRWFAWSCRRVPSLWDSGPGIVNRDEVEAFCVGHTLQNVPLSAHKVLAAVGATEGQVEVTPDCLSRVSGVTGAALEGALYELESAGMISPSVNGETGQVTYSLVPLAVEPTRDLTRKNHWESELVRKLREFTHATQVSPRPDPLIRDLLLFNPAKLRDMKPEEISELKRRVERANQRTHPYRLELSALAAECERHSKNIITADDLYRDVADQVVASGRALKEERMAMILLEAATVAKIRSDAEPQIRRAIGYLQSIETTSFNPLRVLGTLTELHAIIRDSERYERYRKRVMKFKNDHPDRVSSFQISALEEALLRASSFMNQEQSPRQTQQGRG